MREKAWYPVAYMFVVTAVFSGILIGLSAATKERVERNERIFRRRAFVTAAGLADDGASAERIDELYTTRLQPVKLNADGADEDANVIEYIVKAADGDETIGYVVPVYGRGYWDWIRGAMGVGADRKTITGVAFSDQKETPGLGAEIATLEWRNQFAEENQKTLADGDPAFKLRPPGAELDAHSVQAVTGATQTSTRLERFMNRRLAEWRKHTAAADGAEDRP